VGCLCYRPCYARCHYLAGVHRQLQEPPHSRRADEAEEEGVPLSQTGEMSVAEYRDKFIKLSRYAPEEVADDPKKQERFMEGLVGPLRYQLMSHTFPSFQHLLDKAITLESMRRELGDLKRKATTPGQSGRNIRPALPHRCELHFVQEARQGVMASSSSTSTSHSNTNSFSAPPNSSSAQGRRLHALHTSRTVR
jgi:hypothetical protein